jgi:prephenate dehydrogenase
MERVGIVGLGLVGGSLGLALRAACPGVEVVAVARRQATGENALRLGAADRAGTSLELLREADLVILACPLAATAEVLEGAIPFLAPGARVTDVGSVKRGVVEHAARVLDPDRNPFLGGHPMAGKEVGGIDNAEAQLFRGKPWVLTPEPACGYEPERWQDYVEALRAVGALPVFLPAARHDRYVALVSHLPFLLSAAFLNAVGEDPSWDQAAELASSGFRDFSRLGAGDTDMYAAISMMNRDEVLRAWEGLHQAMDQFEAAIARHDGAALVDLLAAARGARRAWDDGHPQPG